MSHYIVGSDKSGNGDTECINKICEVLESAGHTAENIGVTPNLETNLKKGKGNIGVFMVNGICIGTIHSVRKMVEAGGCDFVWFAMPQSINPSNDWLSCESLRTRKVPIAHDDNFTPEPDRSQLDGKYTVSEYCAENSQYVNYACGKDCEAVAQAILNGGSGDGNTSNDSEGEKQVMSGWESCCDLLKGWDGEASMVQRGDCVIVRTIQVPTDTVLKAYEGYNVVDDSVTISDYTPEIYNTFSIRWGEDGQNELEFSFDTHRELFGERKTEVQATKRIPKNSQEAEQYRESKEEENEESSEDSSTDNGGFLGLGGSDSLDDINNVDYSNVSNSDLSSDGQSESQYEEVPITTLEEAIQFGYKTVGKAMRKDGHQIDLKVIGNNEFKVGNWCHVRLPTFFIDGCFYIVKSSTESSADKEYIVSLTLVDYPPSLGSGDSNSPSGSNDSSEGSESDTGSDSSETNDSSTDATSSQDSQYPEAN